MKTFQSVKSTEGSDFFVFLVYFAPQRIALQILNNNLHHESWSKLLVLVIVSFRVWLIKTLTMVCHSTLKHVSWLNQRTVLIYCLDFCNNSKNDWLEKLSHNVECALIFLLCEINNTMKNNACFHVFLENKIKKKTTKNVFL